MSQEHQGVVDRCCRCLETHRSKDLVACDQSVVGESPLLRAMAWVVEDSIDAVATASAVVVPEYKSELGFSLNRSIDKFFVLFGMNI